MFKFYEQFDGDDCWFEFAALFVLNANSDYSLDAFLRTLEFQELQLRLAKPEFSSIILHYKELEETYSLWRADRPTKTILEFSPTPNERIRATIPSTLFHNSFVI